MDNIKYEHIPQEKFEFAQLDADIHDKKLETKSRSYFQDAIVRFKKNKSSVIAAWIIGFLILYAVLVPIISPYSVIDDKDKTYVNFPPYIESIAEMGIGIFDGAKPLDSQSERQIAYLHAIGQETGMDPVIDILGETVTIQKIRGRDVEVKTYKLEVNTYYLVGMISETIKYSQYEDIQRFQNETGIQVLYPAVLQKDIYGDKDLGTLNVLQQDMNIWYKCSDTKGTPKTDKDGNLIPAYTTDQTLDDIYDADGNLIYEYNSTRIEGDDGSYIYALAKSGAVQVRVCYYNYYQYKQWAANEDNSFTAPMYIMGTNEMGQDIFTAIGVGARFSLIFALLVSAINLVIGAVYGAIQGYYGGIIDLLLDRVSDILSGVPMIVVVTLFQLHLASKVGSVPAFLLSFIMTGWIGMAALTRKQFYRFKSMEHIMAARTLGASDWRLMFKHIFPNSLGTIVTSCALVIPGVVSSETSLTYLGIINLSSFAGTTIGTLMEQGQRAMTAAPHAMLYPALFFSLLMISFNLFGNGLRDAFNPTTRGAEG